MEANTKARDSEAKATTQRMYTGKSLDQWLDILENDLDTKTRGSTLPAIAALGREATPEMKARINRALLSSVQAGLKNVSMAISLSDARERASYRSTYLTALVDCNSTEDTFQLLTQEVLMKNGELNENGYALLLGLHPDPVDTANTKELHDRLLEWMLVRSRFYQLDRVHAWRLITVLEQCAISRPEWAEKITTTLPSLVEGHPQLGLADVLKIQYPRTRSTVASYVSTLGRAEEELVQRARKAFTSRESSREVVALASARLARTIQPVEWFQTELIETLKWRLAELAQDPQRLLAALDLQLPNAAYCPESHKWIDPVRIADIDYAQGRMGNRKGPDADYIGSEILGMLSLITRIKAAGRSMNRWPRSRNLCLRKVMT